VKTDEESAEKSDNSDVDKNLFFTSNRNYAVVFMTGSVVFNVGYWSYYSISSLMYQNIEAQGVILYGDPRWGLLGFGLTGVLFYFTRELSRHLVRKIQLTHEGERLGFTMNSYLGTDGRYFETPITNVKYVRNPKFLKPDSYIPLRVGGMSGNILLDSSLLKDDRLKQILDENSNPKVTEERKVDSKEHRIQAIRNLKSKKRFQKS
jgi:hypothetical protein